DRTPALNRVYDLRRVIAGKNKPADICIALHSPAQRSLGISRECICFIKEQYFEICITKGSCPGELFDLVAHNINTPFIGCIEFAEVHLPGRAEKLPSERDRSCRFSHAGAPGEKKMREVAGFHIG